MNKPEDTQECGSPDHRDWKTTKSLMILRRVICLSSLLCSILDSMKLKHKRKTRVKTLKGIR